MQQTQAIDTDAVNQSTSHIRHDWEKEEIIQLLEKPFNDLIYQAHQVHRKYFDPNEVQLSTLLNIKSGGCPEDCAYCPQSARYSTPVDAEPLTQLDDVISAAKKAREIGATRFCMGGAWRSPKEKDFQRVLDMVAGVKELGMETCATLGMLTSEQAHRLKQSGLDYYNHNLDTSEEYYPQIISTRTFDDRLKTLSNVRDAGMNVCCGGIIGMGEGIQDRAGMLLTLANMTQHPESVPINMLVKVAGTPLENEQDTDPLEIIRMIAVSRITMPASYVRLSAGRNEMSITHQALCFFAGANSIFYGEKLLTTDNPDHQFDKQLFERLGIKAKR